MAIGDSIVSICNSGLIQLGELPITSLTDNVKAAVLCAQQYDSTRREVLRSHPWRCAMVQATLAAAPTAPPFTYANAFPLPADCLRVFDLPEDEDEEQWEVVGNAIYTDASAPLSVLYVSNLQDPTAFDPLLASTIAAQLAANIGLALTGDAQKVMAAQRAAKEKIALAQLVSSQEASPRELDTDIWLRARV